MNSISDKRQLCRLCGISKDTVLLHIFAEENSYLLQEIEFLIKIKPSINDSLPPYICHRCNYRVKTFKDFRNKCIETLHHLQDKNIDNDEDDEVVIIDEREGNILVPCPAQHGKNTEKENMSNGQYTELQDTQHLPQPHSLSTSQQCFSEVSDHVDTYTRHHPFHNRVIRKYNLPTSKGHQTAALFNKSRQSPDHYRVQRELAHHQKQALSLHHKHESILKTRKLQHGFLSGSSLSEICPEVVDEQLGTVGYLRTETFTSQSHQARRQIKSLDSNQHDKSTDEARAERLETRKRNGYRVSFSDCESIRLKERDPVNCPLCSREFKNNVTLREHLKFTHGVVQSERNQDKSSFLCQHISQPNIRQQFLGRDYVESFSCKLCNRKFASRLVLKRHIRDNHTNTVEPL